MGEDYKDTWNKISLSSTDIGVMSSINDKVDQTILSLTPYVKMIILAKYKKAFYPKNDNYELVINECIGIILNALKIKD
jgi:hypothetical protein